MHRLLQALLWLLLVAAFGAARADDALIQVRSREGITTSYWWMPRDGAWATVLLFSGGNGGIGMKDGVPQSGNFLIRSRDEFTRAGLNVALVGNPSDVRGLNPAFRRSPEHMTDIRATIDDIRNRSNTPIWLVGTSQGTISAAAAGLALGPEVVAGIALSATLSGQQPGGSVTDLPLEQMKVPVLVHQHRLDSCRITPPALARALVPRLTAAPVSKYMEVEGGSGPRGDPCEAFHWHGYIGMEAQAVEQLVGWIRKPVP